ncbi:TfoX/Sxy family protein [Enterococcus sp. AZ109]|uniref:TfoX/Sxy family protein n=1 Tax=Enterococcus sp. AZ109 TaxID=2774634 RepID=UPI003F2940D2
MNQLTALPNVGEVLAEHLVAIGIDSPEVLRESGTENVFLKIRMQRDAGACLNMLYGIEGAVQGIPKRQLSLERKQQLKQFYYSLD